MRINIMVVAKIIAAVILYFSSDSLLFLAKIKVVAVLLYSPPRIPVSRIPDFGKTNFCNK